MWSVLLKSYPLSKVPFDTMMHWFISVHHKPWYHLTTSQSSGSLHSYDIMEYPLTYFLAAERCNGVVEPLSAARERVHPAAQLTLVGRDLLYLKLTTLGGFTPPTLANTRNQGSLPCLHCQKQLLLFYTDQKTASRSESLY